MLDTEFFLKEEEIKMHTECSRIVVIAIHLFHITEH